ncbi:MAG: chromate transporter, partial [Firmicutes bacterium]|nr:chromate transporter [Bacillota bacterium]
MSRPEDAETVKDISLWELFFEFFKLGAFTIGGGMAMVSLIQGIVVDKKKWL